LETETLTDEEWRAKGAIEGVVFLDFYEANILQDTFGFVPVERYGPRVGIHPQEFGSVRGVRYAMKGQ